MGEALYLGQGIYKGKFADSEIKEGCSLGKNSKENNDRVIVSRRYIAVVDGVSSRNVLEKGKTLSDKIVDIFEYNLRRAYDFKKVLSKTNQMAKEFKEINGMKDFNKDGFVCGVVDKYEGKVYIVGDISLKLNGFIYTKVSQIDELKAIYRSYLINRFIKMGYEIDEVEELDKNKKLESKIIGLDKFGEDNGDKNKQNRIITQDIFIGDDSDFGYMVVNGGSHEIQYEEYELNKGDIVILASDGYPTVKDSLSETEKELKKLLKEDRLCYKTNKQVRGCYKGNVSYDDRTYLKIEIK